MHVQGQAGAYKVLMISESSWLICAITHKLLSRCVYVTQLLSGMQACSKTRRNAMSVCQAARAAAVKWYTHLRLKFKRLRAFRHVCNVLAGESVLAGVSAEDLQVEEGYTNLFRTGLVMQTPLQRALVGPSKPQQPLQLIVSNCLTHTVLLWLCKVATERLVAASFSVGYFA